MIAPLLQNFGASRGNRTLFTWLEAKNNNQYTTDAFLAISRRIELLLIVRQTIVQTTTP